jgi:RsiW-degrading membrane proteinase PrsW (M82 family)
MPTTLKLGRDPGCDIVLADGSISRAHAEVVLFEDGRLFVRDEGSQNGTFVDRDGRRERLQASFVQNGDVIVFGDLQLPESALREMVASSRVAAPAGGLVQLAGSSPAQAAANVAAPHVAAPRPAAAPSAAAADQVARTMPELRDFLPAVAGFDRLRQRGLLLPIIGFAVFVAVLYDADTPEKFRNYAGGGICVGTFVLVYRSCGRHKPLVIIAAVMAVLAGLLLTPAGAPYFFVFRTLTGAEPLAHSHTFVTALVGNFFAAGLMEELMKQTPVFLLIYWTWRSRSERARAWGVSEPLDAIVYACAAATMFILIETLRQYAPNQAVDVYNAVNEKTHDPDFAVVTGFLEATQLAIQRTVDSATGHLAFSGYFAYYVGLGLLRPQYRTRYWIGGYIGAATLHAFSNALLVFDSMAVKVPMNIISVTFLVAAILNARKVSPTRADNFATVSYTRARRPAAS